MYGASYPSERFDFVTIHPLAGEAEQGGTVFCDLYWAIRPHKKAFVSFSIEPNAAPRAFFHPGEGEVAYKFHIVTRQRPLSAEHVEMALAHLDAWFSKRTAFKCPMRVAECELCT